MIHDQMRIPPAIQDKYPFLNDWAILVGYRGSIAHDLYVPSNDAPWDIVVYKLKKFISLVKKGNPNVLSLLWLDEKFLIHQTAEGKLLNY